VDVEDDILSHLYGKKYQCPVREEEKVEDMFVHRNIPTCKIDLHVEKNATKSQLNTN
jgi:hypothetical protein